MLPAMGRLSRIKPIYVVVAAAGVLLILGAFLLLRSSPAPKPPATSVAQPTVAPLPQPPAPSVVTQETKQDKPAAVKPASTRAKHKKWVDPFTVGESNKPNPFTDGESKKPTQNITPEPPRHKAKRKMFQEL